MYLCSSIPLTLIFTCPPSNETPFFFNVSCAELPRSQQTPQGGRVPDSALDRHIRLVRDVCDEDEESDDERGLDALAQKRLFGKLGFAHSLERWGEGLGLASARFWGWGEKG
jgi:hypothetical protein